MALQRRLHSAVYTEWCRSLGALPVPNAGQWLGSTPAGCEVCRGSPAENESPTLDRDLLNQPLTENCQSGAVHTWHFSDLAMSDLGPQSGPMRTLIRSLSPIAIL